MINKERRPTRHNCGWMPLVLGRLNLLTATEGLIPK